MSKRLLAILTAAAVAAGGTAGALAAGPKAPNDGHYANHPRNNLGKNALDFDVVKGNVTAISHYDKCLNVPLMWPKKIPFRKGVFVYRHALSDYAGNKFKVKFSGTAVSTTRINGVLDIKVTKGSGITKTGCHYTLDYKAHRTGPPAGVI
jgi:hypothetical protein